MRSDGDSEASSTVARRRDLEPRTPEVSHSLWFAVAVLTMNSQSQLAEFTQLTAFLVATAGTCHQVEGKARTVERLVQELVDLLVRRIVIIWDERRLILYDRSRRILLFSLPSKSRSDPSSESTRSQFSSSNSIPLSVGLSKATIPPPPPPASSPT